MLRQSSDVSAKEDKARRVSNQPKHDFVYSALELLSSDVLDDENIDAPVTSHTNLEIKTVNILNSYSISLVTSARQDAAWRSQ